ncbi:hypothetical protein N7468_001086 [Penicillium chermesinum]|uniref:Uncharacterized protein n=1 Tax=Penicillium chermesinum TaxID=63820 RepID=A0A9W9PI57_9EURO|nr:uncharacterized protein N7468_001086 [Penicillium chermesinum]KAJ5246103.1 hypothetical protein N7468_001086 [Penicillium chermesinum]
MDSGSTGAAAGIDPNILDNWQSDGAFSVNPWEHLGYEQPLEWDNSQDSSQCADVADLGGYHDSLATSLLDRTGELQHLADRKHDVISDAYNYDGTGEGTGSGTISPQTLPSSADDNFHADEAWPQFQLFNSVAASMALEAPLMQSSGKTAGLSNDAVILEDMGEVHQGQGFPDAAAEAMMFQQMPSTFQMMPDDWSNQESINSENIPVQASVPLPMAPENETKKQPLRDLQTSPQYWPHDIEAQVPATQLSPVSMVSPLNNAQPAQERFQFKSENSSVSGDMSGMFERSYSATSEDPSVFARHQLDDGPDWQIDFAESNSPGAVCGGKTTAFMVSETPSESLLSTMPSRPKGSSHQRNGSRPMPLAVQSAGAVRKRKNRSAQGSIDLGPSQPLQIVQEDGQGGSIASADFVSPPRGSSEGSSDKLTASPPSNVQKLMFYHQCDGSSPCDACRPTLHEQPCARACFSSIVEFGTCNYISQRAVNHPTLDGGRKRMEIPSEFDLGQLLAFLAERQGRFNIRASQAWGSLYVLDLGEAYKFLKSLSEHNGNSKSTFLEFIDRRIVESKDKSKNWLTCVKDCDPLTQAYTLLSQWNNMPSRAKYTFVPLDANGQERDMDINSPEDQRDILLAAQLSRIVCRMMEVEGFRKLERDFYNIKWKQISHETHIRFLRELGHILLSLRWRVSWWKCLGDGSKTPDPTQQHYVDRVELLCRILYVYYTCVLAKLPSWSTSDVPKGTWSSYADSENAIWDDFPSDPSDNGFHSWMDRGQDLIEQAGVPAKVAKL